MNIFSKYLSSDLLIKLFNSHPLNIPWWIEIYTIDPKCLYYFGPFNSFEEATQHQPGYLEDLYHENAQGIRCKILQIEPKSLTIFEEDDHSNLRQKSYQGNEKMLQQSE